VSTSVRKRHTAQFKTKVAVEALKGAKTVNEIASENNLNPGVVSQWKKAALESVENGFTTRKAKEERDAQGFQKEQLLAQIGQLKVELDWLKKRV
jgi:transposase-like protein